MFKNWILLVAGLPILFAITARADDGDTSNARRRLRIARQLAANSGAGYWVGIAAAPVGEALKSHLHLESGVVVQHVVPKSPAGIAGLKQHDILLKFGDTDVSDMLALSKAVADNKGEKVSLSIIREGKRKAIELAPEERPSQFHWDALADTADMKRIAGWLEKLEKGELGDNPARMLLLHPGLEIHKEKFEELRDLIENPPHSLSIIGGNVVVTRRKQGNGPTEIIVLHDGKTWKVTEDELDKLPKSVREHVKRIVERAESKTDGGTIRFDLEVETEQKLSEEESTGDKSTESSGSENDEVRALDATRLKQLMLQIERMNKQLAEREKATRMQLQDLQKQLEKLRK